MTTSRWIVPGTCVVLGLALLGAFAAADQPGIGLVTLGIMLAYAAFLVAGRRVEAVAVLGQADLDERRAAIAGEAAAVTCYVGVGFFVAAFLVDVATGGDGMPWSALSAGSGLVYAASVVVLSVRR